MNNPNIKNIYNRYEKSKISEQTKIREILQQTALLGLERHGFFEKAAFYGVLTLHKSDLFAGKMSAILFRAWKGRVKGRDWYDLIWYIQNKVPLSLPYLEACMRQAGNLKDGDSINRHRLIEMLNSKIQTIDWESAKADMRSFISEPQRLDIWSPQFFSDLINYLQVE